MKLNLKTMIYFFSLAGMMVFSALGKLGSDVAWLSDFDSAITESEESGHPVLMIFSGSDWCRPCMMLRQSVLDSPEFLAFAEKELVLLEVDFPRSKKNKLTPEQLKHNEQLAERFNPNGVFPYVMLLNSQEEILGQSEGHQFSPEDFIELLESWIP